METTEQSVALMREYFNAGHTKDINFRLNALQKLKGAIIKNERAILDALNNDLAKHEYEAYMAEIGLVLGEINYALRRLRRWARPQKVRTPFVHAISKSRIMSEPYGVVLIMSPWNYPFQLTLVPLIAAIAAGNCVVVKPSAYSPNTSGVIYDILGGIFEPQYITTLTGGRDVNKTLLDQNFDYIFFTGSVAVGRTVMEAAAKHLTPFTLELGGKSPCIVDASANVDLAAKRIAWGKFLNAGQTCVAPDYIYVHKSVAGQLVKSLEKYAAQFYGASPQTNADLPKIINQKHFERLSGLLKCGKTAFGGAVNAELNKIAPTVLTDITWDDAVMKEEIFGPILPVLEFERLDEIVAKIKSEPRPLALYLFTTDAKTEKKVLGEISFGGGCVNDTVVHLASPRMPFGGVGASGMGGYHGKFGFDTFSHKKGILKKSNLLDINLRYPPYKRKTKILKTFMK